MVMVVVVVRVVVVMVMVVRVMVKDVEAQETEERVNVKEMVVAEGLMVMNEGTREMEGGMTVKGKVVGVVRVSGEGKERWVMMEEREADKEN